ncbi:hypothetical protein [Xanthomonas sp. 3498]|uniref:hypothetical protein n=1 Tax=Xanthomonas sp. 3498 TaxID=2663863 RepID=UPI00160B5C82|nr:hypothetical protein [Xanthomonas sp. 3498]MBB5878837.1 hypothetical protein [Xanthomonas sp. 3498]
MQVYANKLSIEGAEALHACLRAIHGWFKSLMQADFDIEDICRNGGEYRGGALNARLRCYSCTDAELSSYAWRIKHRDRDVKGRQWVVDLALEGDSQNARFYCSLAVDDMSTLIRVPVVASRPRVITYIKKNVDDEKGLSFKGAIGTSIKSVAADRLQYIALVAEIERADRDFPLVLLTPMLNGNYLISPESLQESLFGLAQVVVAQKDYDHYDLQVTLGRRFSSKRGEPCIIGTMGADNTFSVARISTDVDDIHAEIIAAVTHRTNVPKLRRMLRPENVVSKSLYQRMSAAKAALADGEQTVNNRQELEDLWRQLLEHSEQERDQLQENFDDTSYKIMQLEDELNFSRDENRNLRYINESLRSNSRTEEIFHNPSMATCLTLLRNSSKPSPRECLELISASHSKNCEILDSAYDSADKVPHFQHGGRLLDMLLRLVNEYADILKSGKGDSEARKTFTPNEFSATESDSVTKSSLKEKRKFRYNDKDIYMFSHLKVGVADNENQTIRVHFEWIDEKIVIGYCGFHLPL